MTRLEKLDQAVEILSNANKICKEHFGKVLYVFDVNEDDLTITFTNVVFFDQIMKMDFLYVRPLDCQIQIQF